MDKPISKLEFDDGNNNDNKNNGKYKVETIWDNAIYAKELKRG